MYTSVIMTTRILCWAQMADVTLPHFEHSRTVGCFAGRVLNAAYIGLNNFLYGNNSLLCQLPARFERSCRIQCRFNNLRRVQGSAHVTAMLFQLMLIYVYQKIEIDFFYVGNKTYITNSINRIVYECSFISAYKCSILQYSLERREILSR